MKTLNTQTEKAFQNLVKGQHYLVKHSKGDKYVRRFFKGTENRFDSILCYVFSSQVSPKTKVGYIEEEQSFTMSSPYGTKTPNMEITIPFYDIIDVKQVKA